MAGSIVGCRLSRESPLECTADWQLKLPSDHTLTNAVALADGKILSGCSDNNIYAHDRQTLQETCRLTGHQDYVHCLKVVPQNGHSLLYSASEDGSVRAWDIRASGGPLTTILPFKQANLERPSFGKWIGAIDVTPNNEWLLCGGGPSLSIWHLRSNKCAYLIHTPAPVYAAQFLPTDLSSVIAAGGGNQITVWQRSDHDGTRRISSSIDNIYSLAFHRFEEFDYDLFSLAGDSFKIELCKNAKFIDWQMFVH